MAEGFTPQSSSSSDVISRLNNRTFKELYAYFGDRLLDSPEKKQFYLKITQPKFDTVRLWIYDDRKRFTQYGIQCTTLLDRLESLFIKLKTGEDDSVEDNVLKCGTKSESDFYPYGDSRFHDNAYDFCFLVRDVSMAIVRKKPEINYLH